MYKELGDGCFKFRNELKKRRKDKMRDVLIYDIETDSLNTDKAKVKWFGAYSYLYDKYYLIPFDREEIQDILDRHRVLVGFNK